MQKGGTSLNKAEQRKSMAFLAIIVAFAALVGFIVWWFAQQIVTQNVQFAQPQSNTNSNQTPKINTEVIVDGRQNIWDIGFLPQGQMLFTERNGRLNIVNKGEVSLLSQITDVAARGEGGLLGMVVDPGFAKNRFIYTCFNSTKGPDVRVVRWQLNQALNGLQNRQDIITGMPSKDTGRHSGCRLAFGPDGYLWIGTGDSATGDIGQQPKSLGGKILRIDQNGKPAPGNLGEPYDARIYSYGHRNTQGIAFFSEPRNDILGVSVEHGSSMDDEINPLKTGNFGWAPPADGYNEIGVPMTDKKRFPQAVDTLWSSGSPAQAPSGAAIIKGGNWQAWEGAIAMAMLRDQHLKILTLNSDLKITREEKILTNAGRLRTVVQASDNSLYVSTDNGINDQIIRISVR